MMGEMADESRGHAPGEMIVHADVVGTALFAVTAIFAAASFSTAAQWVGAVTSMVLFAAGVVAFLWAFYHGVQRSRSEQVSVTQLFLLLGDVAPARVRRIMLSLVFAQFAVALATTLARPNGPNGSPGSSLAVGFLVPMFGFGLNGLWAAYHGSFEARDDAEALAARVSSDTSEQVVRTETGSIGKNGEHG